MSSQLQQPPVLSRPFAEAGDKNVIPENATGTQAASLEEGFPEITSTPISQGGIPPERRDFNGLGNLLSSQYFFLQNGGHFTFSQDVSDAIGGYAKDSVLWYQEEDGEGYFVTSMINNNTYNFVASPEYIDGTKWKKLSGGGGGLEIGDMGFTPLDIDEAQNRRRYLNGQVISQSQFVSFTNKVKATIQLNPSLATTEVNWQAEVTNSPYGICGKFVIDDVAGTIRLPKYPDWSIREVGQAAVAGNGNTLGLTNGTTINALVGGSQDNKAYLAVDSNATGTVGGAGTPMASTNYYNKFLGITTDSTKSGIIADLVNANTEDKLPGKWFIQVATGVEEDVDISTEIQLNNPFSLLDYKYSEYELSNASWLLSNGQFNSGATYSDVYDLLLQIYNETVTKAGVSVKLSTEAYTDTDFVLNTSDTTFRLPTKVLIAGSKRISGNGMTLGLTDGTDLSAMSHSSSGQWTTYPDIYNKDVGTAHTGGASTSQKAYGVTTDPTKSGIETSSTGLYLYFYVGETIQDANIIAAASVLTDMTNIKNGVGYSSLGTSFIAEQAMPSGTWESVTIGASGATYIAPSDGYFVAYNANANAGKVRLINQNNGLIMVATSITSFSDGGCFVPCKKGDEVMMTYSGTFGSTNGWCRFVYSDGTKWEKNNV